MKKSEVFGRGRDVEEMLWSVMHSVIKLWLPEMTWSCQYCIRLVQVMKILTISFLIAKKCCLMGKVYFQRARYFFFLIKFIIFWKVRVKYAKKGQNLQLNNKLETKMQLSLLFIVWSFFFFYRIVWSF